MKIEGDLGQLESVPAPWNGQHLIPPGPAPWNAQPLIPLGRGP